MRRSGNGAGAAALAGVVVCFAVGGAVRAADPASKAAKFPVAKVRFEQNATDGDVEVVILAVGRSEGLAKLLVTGPDGRTVADFSAPDGRTLGMREFELESPEPRDTAKLRAAYPEGTYRFTGKTASGAELVGESQLSHALPTPTEVVHPADEAENVPLAGLEIRWAPVAGVRGYIVELENDDLDFTLEVKLPATATRFAVPPGLLLPGTEYELGVATVSPERNVSFVETSFTTAR
jgi:hypothetical protein